MLPPFLKPSPWGEGVSRRLTDEGCTTISPIHIVGNGFIRSVSGRHECLPYRHSSPFYCNLQRVLLYFNYQMCKSKTVS